MPFRGQLAAVRIGKSYASTATRWGDSTAGAQNPRVALPLSENDASDRTGFFLQLVSRAPVEVPGLGTAQFHLESGLSRVFYALMVIGERGGGLVFSIVGAPFPTKIL